MSALGEREAARLAANFYKHPQYVKLPAASILFPRIDARLDARLRTAGLDRDMTVCEELAALTHAEQPEFLDLYQRDPADARYWAKLPRWKRPIRKGDETDRAIWKFFVQQRLAMDCLDKGRRISWKVQGNMFAIMTTGLRYVKDNERFSLCLSTFGDMLHNEEDLGDVQHPPWEEA